MNKKEQIYFNFPIVLLEGFLINDRLVLDNIFDDELEDLVSTSVTINSKKHSPSEVPRLIAQDIAFKARYFSEDSRRESPFSVEARKHGLSYLGGKEDDITVIASVIYNKKQ